MHSLTIIYHFWMPAVESINNFYFYIICFSPDLPQSGAASSSQDAETGKTGKGHAMSPATASTHGWSTFVILPVD